jgi:hypothetical protein
MQSMDRSYNVKRRIVKTGQPAQLLTNLSSAKTKRNIQLVPGMHIDLFCVLPNLRPHYLGIFPSGARS